MEQAIIDLEKACTLMYETTDSNVREQAQKHLISLVDDSLVLPKCRMLLQRASSPYAMVIAASTLSKKATPNRQGTPLPIQERYDIRCYVLNYLYSCTNRLPFVTDELMQLYAHITKISWFETDKDQWFFRDVIPEISKFLQGDVDKCTTGIQLFKKLVENMNSMVNFKPLKRHWKVASSFRDASLHQIFQIACDLLSLVSANQMQENQQGFVASVLELSLACLSYDFIGTSVDESSDDLSTVQIPTSWRENFVNLTISHLFFNLYKILPANLSALVISCLVQIVSIRRSLFNNVERSKFLNDVMKGIKEMLETSQKLVDEVAFHEFCRMLARLKSNYQLSELVKIVLYADCMRLIASFTINSLRHCHFSQNSVHYLLSLWQRLASSVPYVKAQEPHYLENYMPEVFKAFLESSLQSVDISFRDGTEKRFEELNLIQQQLDQVSTIARCGYPVTCQLLGQSYDENIEVLRNLLSKDPSNIHQQQVVYGKLTWVVYLIGAVIGGRVSFAATDEHDIMDGALVIRVLQLMELTDNRLSNGNGVASIESSILYFFEQFRKVYIGEQVQKISKIYKRLNEVLSIKDDNGVLDIIIKKIITNLKYWSENNEILSKTLNLLNELSIGFSSVRKLKKLPTVQVLLDKDPTTLLPFLSINSKLENTRCRTTFYKSIGRLLITDLGDAEERFRSFMSPIIRTISPLKQLVVNLPQNNDEALKECAMNATIAVSRDLRGIIFSFNSKTAYSLLFDMIHPEFTELLRKAIEIWSHEPRLTTPVLKLFIELVLNRGQRLQFEVSSPNGILLFKEASKAVCVFGTCLLETTDLPKEKFYSHRLKGIILIFRLLKNALCGGYVNFGMFCLYKDPCLDDALNIFIKLVTSLPSATFILEYPKLANAYFSLFEVITQDHITFISRLSSNIIYHLLSTVIEGITAIGM